MLNETIMIAVGVLLTAGTAIFVASEFSLVTLDPAVVGSDDEEGDSPEPGRRAPDRRDRIVRSGLKHLSTELSSAQVGITVTTILLGYTAQPALLSMFGAGLAATPLGATAAGVLAGILALVVVNAFSMLFGELIPKNFALSAPHPTARAVVPLQRIFTIVCGPLIAMFNGSANAILRRMGIEPREELSGARSATELLSLVRRSAQEGTLEKGTATLLANSLELNGLVARDVMTDRTRMSVVRRDTSAAEVLALAHRTGHSRFPVIGDDRDDIVGLVHLRRAVGVPFAKRDEVPAGALMTDAPRVPDTVSLGPLLVELRGLGLQMAVVVDEYGGTSGVVTLEDVVEELVGDVADEHDRRRGGATRAADGTWTVPGVLRPDELAETTGLRVPEGSAYETLGGLVMAHLGRLPEAGDKVEVGDVLLRVELVDGRRVERLRVQEVAS